MKTLRRIVCLCLCAVMSLGFFGGCQTQQQLNPETRPLMLAIGALDSNFNPFFATSLNDTQIAGLTQVNMITADENGDPACGENWPTVAKDYKITMFDANGNESVTGSTEGTTSYEFLIKNGIKYSNGSPLTIKDVLFNLYVYLDPAYTGSATIYSTDIVGLKAYRAQDPELTDDAENDYESGFYANALGRVEALKAWSTGDNTGTEADLPAETKADLETVKRLFAEEANSDWTSIETSWYESYKDTHNFTSAWQAYLFNEGVIEVQTKLQTNGSYTQVKDSNGKYLTTLDADENGDIRDQHVIDEMVAAASADKVSAYMTANNCSEEYAITQLQKATAVDIVIEKYTTKQQIANILSYWATAGNALEDFAADFRSKYYADAVVGGKLLVPNISGITTYKTNEFNGRALGEEYSVLKIVINGVDPKALWNFAFSVSPMYYYSNQEQIDLFDGDDESVPVSERSHFGVKIGDKTFFNDVLKSTSKNGLPVGAGTYMASSADGSKPDDKGDFFSNNIVYYERNPYFETLGSGLCNAKIKYMYYKVMGDDKIMSALSTKEIDYGEPNATPANVNESTRYSYLTADDYRTAGYGYVGINPKFVKDVKIRRAIMKAMNTSLIVSDYYGEKLAETIYRPMSRTSWAYPNGAEEYNGRVENANSESITYDVEGDEIEALVAAAGYVKKSDGFYHHEDTDEKLTFTFTIAGETTDHPAYAMFLDAQKTLNDMGWDISVKPDILALKKMNSGDLAVWAAAWSSGVDPDMYQVYHKDSKATSVNNWNYSGILNDTQGIYTYEKGIVEALSEKIDEARSVLTEPERIPLYAECLDLVMDLAVELPTYQRNDLAVYNNTVIDSASVNGNPTHNMGVIGRLWLVNYK